MKKVNVKCETDCSNFVACCANCAGIAISPQIYTGNEESAFKATGLFEFHRESKYLNSDQYLPRGAVLLSTGHHTAINLTEHCATVKQGWEKVGSNKYYYKDGKKLVKEWVKDTDNCWYRLGNSGEMLTGLHQIYDSKGKLRYAAFDAQGRMLHEGPDKQGYLDVWVDKS